MKNASERVERNEQELRPPGELVAGETIVGDPIAGDLIAGETSTTDIADGHTAAPKKIFVSSPFRPRSKDENIRKEELQANLNRAMDACAILAAIGYLPLAPHLYFTQFLNDADEQEREQGIRLGMQWLEAADEVWTFGEYVSQGMKAELARAKELGKVIRRLPEPGRTAELLIKALAEAEENHNTQQRNAAESEKRHGEE